MAIPRPGQAVRGSRSGRPIMAALDLMGRRWVLRILWELRGPALTFRALQQQCGDISPTVLNARLGELRHAGLVAAEGGYNLTAIGREAIMALAPLTDWAERWADQAGERPPARPAKPAPRKR